VIGDWLLEKRKAQSVKRKADGLRSSASLRMMQCVILRSGGPRNFEALHSTQSDKSKIPLFFEILR